jgi:hypothetical protein
MPYNTEIRFWLQHEYVDGGYMRFHTVFIVSHDVESAIKEAFGFTGRPASPIKYDVCTQQDGEAGYRYWYANRAENEAALSRGVN